VSASSIIENDGPGKGEPLPREGRIAISRNAILDHIASSHAPTDFIIVIDLDIVGWDPLGIFDTLGRNDWDVVCAHGVMLQGEYRDTYALRIGGIDTNHHIWPSVEGGPTDYNPYAAKGRAQKKLLSGSGLDKRAWLKGSPRSLPLIHVDSCFGGLAVYRAEALLQCRYTFRRSDPPYLIDNEHTLLHRCMANKVPPAKIFSNPNM